MDRRKPLKKLKTREVPSRFMANYQKPVRKPQASPAWSDTTQVTRSKRPTTATSSGARPLREELEYLDTLSAILLQWQYSNAIARRVYTTQEASALNQIFDRGQQVVQQTKRAQALEADLTVLDQTSILDGALQLEYSNLAKLEDSISAVSSHIQEIEGAAYYSLHRVALPEDLQTSPGDLKDTLHSVQNNLVRITSQSEHVNGEVQNLGDDMGDLTDTVEETRDELQKSAKLLIELKSLYDQEKVCIAGEIQKAQQNILESLAFEEVI